MVFQQRAINLKRETSRNSGAGKYNWSEKSTVRIQHIRVEQAEERTSEVEDRSFEIIQSLGNKKNKEK